MENGFQTAALEAGQLQIIDVPDHFYQLGATLLS